jgi:hypothetical protein
MKRGRTPEGVTMHGIESLDRDLHQDYNVMSEEKLRKFVAIDGHIGLEAEGEIADRFRAVFKNVETRARYTLCLSAAEFVKQADEYEVPLERDFIEYLRGLSFNERRAFDMAMGYVFSKISDLDVRLPNSGLYMLLKASDAPLEGFYNAHRDRQDLFGSVGADEDRGGICLDRDSRATFDSGWYAANNLPPVARWMGRRAGVRFEAASVSQIKLDLTTHIPKLNSDPLNVEFRLNGNLVAAFSLIDYGWLQISTEATDVHAVAGSFELEIQTSRTWQPKSANPASQDDRDLSIAVCNIQVL